MKKTEKAAQYSKNVPFSLGKFIISVLIAVLMFFPIYTVIVGGFKTKGQLLSDPFGIPRPFTLEAYEAILGKIGRAHV